VRLDFYDTDDDMQIYRQKQKGCFVNYNSICNFASINRAQ